MTRIGSAHREELERRGLVHLSGFLSRESVEPAASLVRETLEDRGVLHAGTLDLSSLRDVPVRARTKELMRGIKKHGVFADLVTEDLARAVADLAGSPVVPMLERPQLLFSLPDADAWQVPRSVWHVDLPAIANRGLEGLQAFAFLEEVRPGGGGTVVVAGSHRLLDSVPVVGSKQVKNRLRQLPYFEELFAHGTQDRSGFLRPRDVEGVELQVVELCGKPGDVVFMNLRLLHAPAPNVGPSARVMVTQRFLLEESKQDLDTAIEAFQAAARSAGSTG